MKTPLCTRTIQTGDIKLESNRDSIIVNGVRISRLEEIPGQEKENPSTIYLDFLVRNPIERDDTWEASEEVDLVFNMEDAIELGLLMVGLGMEHKTDDEVEATISRLSNLIAQYR
jgi:hypothetical protein